MIKGQLGKTAQEMQSSPKLLSLIKEIFTRQELCHLNQIYSQRCPKQDQYTFGTTRNIPQNLK